jgi:hypothetical protein
MMDKNTITCHSERNEVKRITEFRITGRARLRQSHVNFIYYASISVNL